MHFSEHSKTRTGEDDVANIGKQMETSRIQKDGGRDFPKFT